MTGGPAGVATIVVIAKQPVPGRVKTRLIGARTPDEAAELARCAILDTLAVLRDFPCRERVLLFDGDPAGLVPEGWQVIGQSGGGLDERLAAGFEQLPDAPALLVGMDTPQLSLDALRFAPADYDACLGPAADGGFWAIGFAEPKRARGCIAGVPMSTSGTGAEQHRRLVEAGLSVQLLPMLTDVDDEATADEVARAAPETRFARRWRQDEEHR